MLEGGRISEAELVTMLMYTVLGTAYFSLPSVASSFTGHDAWLVPIIGTLTGVLVAGITGYFAVHFPGFNFFDWTEIILGRTSGKILQFFYVLFFIHVATVIINEFTYFMHIAFMPLTPSLVFSTLLLFLTGVAVYGGIETIGRLATVFLPVTVVISSGMLILAAGLYDFANLMPFLDRGVAPVLAGSISLSGLRSEIFLGAMLLPFIKRPDQGEWAQFRANLWIGLFLMLISLSVALAFGDEGARLSLPVYSLAREISLMNFFEHLESLALILWISSIFMKVAVWEYVTIFGTAQWLNLKSYRPLVLPMGLLLAALANYDMPNGAVLSHFAASVIPFEVMLFAIILPGILAVLSLFRTRPAYHWAKRKSLPVSVKRPPPIR